MKEKIQRPNKRNVQRNDFGEGIITAENAGRLSNRRYSDSLVLKLNGTYLIGENFYIPLYRI